MLTKKTTDKNSILIVQQAKINLDSLTEYDVSQTLKTKSAAFSINLQPSVNRIKIYNL
jgi:hypothetical protein